MTASGLPVRIRPEVADAIETYAGLWSYEAIGRRVGLSARAVENYSRKLHVRATEYKGWWTSGAAAEYMGKSQQWLTSLARRGLVRARRNASYYRGRRRRQARYRNNSKGWWMFDPDDLRRLKSARDGR
jgi:hypothetical protein